MKVKLIDLTLRQIIKICDKNNKNCRNCPLFKSQINCFKFDERYKIFGETYDRKMLMEEMVELDEKNTK